MYQQYFDNYEPSSQAPCVRIPKISPLYDGELMGHFMHCAAQYLINKKFPPQLITALVIQLRKESRTFDLAQTKLTESEKLATLPEDDDDIWYNPQKVKDVVVTRLDELCLKYSKQYCSKELELPSQHIHDISYSSLKNRRRTLEDRFVAIPCMDTLIEFLGPTPVSYFAVFDGHNGAEAASYAATHLHLNLVALESFPFQMERALQEAFVVTDDEFVTKCGKTGNQSGTTALVAVIFDSSLFVAWAGDSQAILAIPDKQPMLLVHSHKPENEDETSRIVELGGQVINGRVSGVLAVSRAIGDLDLKEFVIPNPDVTRVDLNGDEEFLVLASDGLWDDVSPEMCVGLVKEHIVANCSTDGLSQKLAEAAEFRGSSDNTTVLVVCLQPLDQLLMKYTDEISNQPPINISEAVAEPKASNTEVPEASSELKNGDYLGLNTDKLLHNIPNSSPEDNANF